MRALQVTDPDGPDSVLVADVPPPGGDAPLVIDVHAAGVGFADLLMSRGEHQIRQEPPFTLGWEAAGVVVRAPSASDLRAGDEVVTLTLGAFAERIAAVPEATFRLPAGLSLTEGAAFPMNYLTALAGLERRGRLQAGETVLVHGAAGGVGTAAIQVGRGLGARVIAVVSSEEKAGVARAAGADEVVVSADGEWRQAVLDLAPGGVERDPRSRRRRPAARQPALPGLRGAPRRGRLRGRRDPADPRQPPAAEERRTSAAARGASSSAPRAGFPRRPRDSPRWSTPARCARPSARRSRSRTARSRCARSTSAARWARPC